VETKKPGTTRLAFVVICTALLIIGTPIIIYAVKSPIVDLKDMVMMGIGAIVGALGTAVAFYFGSE
jgi:hypothetical protein